MKLLPPPPLLLMMVLGMLASDRLMAAERIAFLVGCGNYQSDTVPGLETPEADVKELAVTLSRPELAFECVTLVDGTVEQIYAGLESFQARAKGARVALFFFSGHGIEHAGENYLIPVDAKLDSAVQLRTQAVNLTEVMAGLAKTNAGVKLAVLDCCRDNPFAATKSWVVTKGLRDDVLRELGEAEIPASTLVCFATSAGRKAAAFLDESSTTSPFTHFLAKELPKPGASLRDIFEGVHDKLEKATDGRQVPAIKTDNALSRVFRETILVPGAGGSTAPPPPAAGGMKENAEALAKLQAENEALRKAVADRAAYAARQQEAMKAREEAGRPSGKNTAPSRPHPVRSWPAHEAVVGAVAISPDDKMIATGGNDGHLNLWNAETGALIRRYENDKYDIVGAAQFSPDNRLVACGARNVVRIWDVATGELKRTLLGHSRAVVSLAWSRDGQQMATGSMDYSVRIWSTTTGGLLQELRMHKEGVFKVAWSPNGRILASGGYDGKVNLWDTSSWTVSRTLTGNYQALNGTLGNNDLVFSPDGGLLVTHGAGKYLMVWDMNTGLRRPLGSATGATWGLQFAKDGRTLYWATDQTLTAIHPETGAVLSTFDTGSKSIRALDLGRSGATLVGGAKEQSVLIWNVAP